MLMNMILIWLVTAVSLFIISRLNIGIEIDDLGTTLVAAIVVGLINALVRPIVAFFALPFTILTLGLFWFVVNALMFMLAASLVPGFRLRNGFWSALLGSILLVVLNSIIFWIVR
jgi:putative membrane protein